MVCHKFRKLKRSELIKVRFPQVSKGLVPFISTTSPHPHHPQIKFCYPKISGAFAPKQTFKYTVK